MRRFRGPVVALAVVATALVGVVLVAAAGCRGGDAPSDASACGGGDAPSELAGASRRSVRADLGQAIAAETAPLTVRVNVSTNGKQANGWALGAVLSANGRYVAFASGATTLVPRDRNRTSDVFVRDLRRSRTTRFSVSSSGAESNGASLKPSISADGHTVAFPSSATNLVRGDRNGFQDIFVRDWASGTTRRVSVGDDGESNGSSLASLVSGDGSVVVFSSEASNLVSGDRNGVPDVFAVQMKGRRTSRISVGVYGESAGRSEASAVSARGRIVAFRSFAVNLVRDDWNEHPDVFVHDRRTGMTERVNVSSTGVQANGATFRGMLSGDGRFVGFRSRASNLVSGDTNDAMDVFVHDRVTGETRRISVATDGGEADASGLHGHACENVFMSRPFLSSNGRYAAFTSRAANLVAGDRNGMPDVFVHDLKTGRTVRISVTADGREANGGSFVSGISADGRVVAFQSLASNLVPGDTNRRKDVFVAVAVRSRLSAPWASSATGVLQVSPKIKKPTASREFR
jgi:Tol biopolymer transport system component